jgi:Tol biopolymer transport system component
MKSSLLCLLLPCSLMVAGVRSPDERVITDPKTIQSIANPAARPIAIDALLYSRSVSGPTWSPDGKEIAFTTNLTGRQNLWKVAAAGGWPVQLLQSDDRQTGATWSPDGQSIAYQQDKAGDELYEIYAVPAKGGEPVNLTKTDDVSETAALWSPDGALLAFAAKRKVEANSNVCVLDPKSRQLRALTAEKSPEYSWSPSAWSADGRLLLAERGDIGATDSDVYLITVATGSAENLTPHEGKILHSAAGLSPDGSTVLIGSNAKGGIKNVALLEVATKKLTWVTDLQWETSPGEFAPDGRSFTYTVNEDGRTELYLVNRASLRAEKLPLPEGLSGFSGRPRAFSPDGRQMLVTHQSSQRPSDFWVYDVAGRAFRQLSVSAIAGLDAIPPSQLVHYRSFDGTIISAFLWVPYNLKRDGTNPGIVLPHGGPTGQTVDSFNRTVAALSSRG